MRRLPECILLLLALLLALPVVSVAVLWFSWPAQSTQILSELLATVLPGYAATSAWLCLGVGVGVALVGTATAVAVALFDFPGRRHWEWALLLPLAMPAYVVAYAYTDFLQYSGPLQQALRSWFGWQGRVFPQVRSTGGAVVVFVCVLYPYVYLLVRAALAERAAHLMEAARMLGAGLRQRIVRVALPMARPAVAAGVTLALMETLADFGVSSYFGIQTFTAGIYKAWLAMDNRIAAAQLAGMLLAVVGVLLALERRAQRRLRFTAGRGSRAGSAEAQPIALRGGAAALAWCVCALPVVLGFVLPVLFMLRPLALQDTAWPGPRFWDWTFNSLRLATLSAVLALAIAGALAFWRRRTPGRLSRTVTQLVGLGYAVPGAVIVVGLLLPVEWLQATWPQAGPGVWMTSTVLGVVWAYLVRFVSVALQSLQSGYARLSPTLDDSARLLGVSGARLWRQVHAPLLTRSAAAALLLVFVDVMKELPATLVLRPFNSDTLAVAVYQLARDERLGEAALPALALVLAGLVPVVLLSRTLREKT